MYAVQDFISRAVEGPHEVSVIEQHRNAYVLVALSGDRRIKKGLDSDLAYKHRNWRWFQDQFYKLETVRS